MKNHSSLYSLLIVFIQERKRNNEKDGFLERSVLTREIANCNMKSLNWKGIGKGKGKAKGKGNPYFHLTTIHTFRERKEL